MKQRLSAIPVFAVVNNKNEFVLVTGDDGVRQLGMFFFRKEDAEGFISTVRFSLYMMISRLKMCLKLLFIFMWLFFVLCISHSLELSGLLVTLSAMQIKEKNPKLGKSARVLMTSMDSVYEFSVTPRENTNTEGIVFRFMPDASQVAHALEVRSKNFNNYSSRVSIVVIFICFEYVTFFFRSCIALLVCLATLLLACRYFKLKG